MYLYDKAWIKEARRKAIFLPVDLKRINKINEHMTFWLYGPQRLNIFSSTKVAVLVIHKVVESGGRGETDVII